MVWKPNVTVAAVIERDGKFLLVEEETDDGIRFNQPAGHLECREALTDAVIREALEETGYAFDPKFIVGIYNWRNEAKDITYLRFAYRGRVGEPMPGAVLDAGIVRTVWMTPDEVRASVARHRSPMLLRCMEDHLAGRRQPLDTVWCEDQIGPQP